MAGLPHGERPVFLRVHVRDALTREGRTLKYTYKLSIAERVLVAKLRAHDLAVPLRDILPFYGIVQRSREPPVCGPQE